MSDDYLIEQFSLEPSGHGRLAALITETFGHDTATEGGTIAFDEETFRFMYGSPAMPRDLFVRAIHRPTGEIVGFLGGLPRTLMIGGKAFRFGVPSFASVHFRHRRKGLAARMGLKLLEVARDRGYEGAFAFFEPEAHGIDFGKAFARDTGHAMVELARIRRFIIRVFDIRRAAGVVKLKLHERLGLGLLQGVKEVRNPRVRRFAPGDAVRMFELMRDHQERNQISVVRDREDFLWYVLQPGINCVVHTGGDGQVDGFILAWKFNLAGFGRTVPFGWLDLVHTHRLAPAEAADLCRHLCVTSRGLGWAGLQTPCMPYFDPAPLKKARFVSFPKTLIVALFPFTPVKLPDRVDTFYLDWR